MRKKSKGSGTWPREMLRSSRPRRCAAFFAQIPKIGTRSFGAKKMEAGQTPEKELQIIAGLRNQAILGKTLPLNAAYRLPQGLAAKPSLPLAASCNSKQACNFSSQLQYLRNECSALGSTMPTKKITEIIIQGIPAVKNYRINWFQDSGGKKSHGLSGRLESTQKLPS